MYFQWKRYIPGAERRAKAARHAAKARRAGRGLSPVVTQGRTIASTFWGKAWCDNLERYSDYANRLPRGRTYVRNGSVIDLQVSAGHVSAQVVGSDLYRVKVSVAEVPRARWTALSRACTASIDSLVELLQGRFSQHVMQRICAPDAGLFPSPKEIKFDCSCPDWAAMCKHVAAVLYGVGARLDDQPELLFTLRKIDAKDLVARAGEGLPLPSKGPGAGRVLEDSKLSEMFDIEMANAEPGPPRRGSSSRKATRAVSRSPTRRKKSARRYAAGRR